MAVLFLIAMYELCVSPRCDVSGFCGCGCAGREGFCPCSAASSAPATSGEGFVGNDYKNRADYLSKKFADPDNQKRLESYNSYSKIVKNGDSAEWYDLINIKHRGGKLSRDNIYATFMSH